MSSATQRTLNLLRTQGYFPWIVEKFNAHSGRRTDLYHIIDILFVTRKNTVGVQSCGTDFAGHVKKLMVEEKFNTEFWLRNPTNELILIGWRKVKYKRGGKLMIYKPRIAFFTMKKSTLTMQEVQYKWLRRRK